jgi:hypothetical protein
VLTRFVVLQRFRTQSAADDLAQFSERLLATVYNGEIPEAAKAAFRVPALKIAIPVAIDAVPIATKLAMHVFTNTTTEEFITSDHPAVAHNTYCEGNNSRGVLGWACRGLQIFLPLSPKHLLMMFDGQVYGVGTNHSRDASAISHSLDAQALNSLQILAADKNVYFQSQEMAEQVREHVRRLQPLRAQKRLITVTAERKAPQPDTSEIIHQFERLLPVNLALRSVRIRRNMSRTPKTFRAQKGGEEVSVRKKLMPPTVRYAVKNTFED